MRTAIHLVLRACLAALLLAVPGGAALAMAIVDSSLTISNLTITPATGSASFELPLNTSASGAQP
jgi:predicted secreted Zn-dependent protease